MSDKISSYIKSKANTGINCSQEQKTLSLITRVLSDIRNNMSKISPAKISNNNGIISKVKRWANDNPQKANSLMISLVGIGAIAGMRAGIKVMKDADARIKTSMRNYDARMKAEKEVLDKKHENNMKVIKEMNDKIREVMNNVDLNDTEASKKAEKEIEEIRSRYKH